MADDLAMTAEKAVGNGRMKELYVVTKTLSQEKQNCECSLKMRLEIYKQKKQPRKKGGENVLKKSEIDRYRIII